MYIDFTAPAILIDPERFPTGLVVQVLTIPQSADRRGLPRIPIEDGISGDFGRADPILTEDWPVKKTKCQRMFYSLTEQRDYVSIEEENYVDFWVRSQFLGNENTILPRSFTVTVTERTLWTVEIEVEAEQQFGPNPRPSLFAIPMPHFNPQATLTLEELNQLSQGQPQPKETPGKKPGKPLWERLDDEEG